MRPSRKVLNGGVLAVSAFVVLTLCGLVFPGDGFGWLSEHLLFTTSASLMGVLGVGLMVMGLVQQVFGRGRAPGAQRTPVSSQAR